MIHTAHLFRTINFYKKKNTMKMRLIALGTLSALTIGLWSCSNNSDDPVKTNQLSLKESLNEKTVSLEQAVSEISSSKGYEILTMKESSVKSGSDSDSLANDDSFHSINISIDDLKGIYDYQLDSTHFGMHKHFTRTEDSDKFIIRLPKEKAYNRRSLFETNEADTTLVNDFVITTSDFQYNYSGGFPFNYLLDTRIDVEEEFAGALRIDWSMNSIKDLNYSSTYSFTDDYSVSTDFQMGDTIRHAYSLMQNSEIIYAEKISFIKSEESHRREREYSIVIGNIEIVRSSGSDNILVYKDGVLQENASVEVLSNDGSIEDEVAFCRKGRDLRITFDDGTTVVLSELVGDSLEILNELFGSLREVYFSTHLVNHIAFDIYSNKE